MLQTSRPPMRGALLALLALSVTGCAAPTSLPSLPVDPPKPPPLPQAARQLPAPDWCSPDCSTGVQTYYRAARQALTSPASPGLPASAAMTR